MSDVELLFCTVPAAPDLLPLLDLVSMWQTPVAARAARVPDLATLVAKERAGTAARWTPHYDRALAQLAVAPSNELLDPCWGCEPDPQPYDRWTDVRRRLAVHGRLCAQLSTVEARGGRTLADAFDVMVIGTDELADWFELHPDPESLDRRLRLAAHAYFAATPQPGGLGLLERELIAAVVDSRSAAEIHGRRMEWHCLGPDAERRCAMSILIADLPSQLDFSNVPLALVRWLGNPFAPLLG